MKLLLQVSQGVIVRIWSTFLPGALTPLWQLAHVPGNTPVCGLVAGVHDVVPWQVLQTADV
ncbi:MAG: hypothetical protein IPJ12_19500 [Betaproteobacteria bacterium]|nr:hypothetical protein [Betaproteobacteria bacterium]